MTEQARHVPVMLPRIIDLVSPAMTGPDPVFVDCTLGLAGHSAALLQAVPSARLIGIDRDADALALAEQRLAEFAGRTTLVHAAYDELPRALAEAGVSKVQAVLMDLGLSSLQIDRAERGFAYAVDAPLDMRMDTRSEFTAADLLNTADEAELVRILRTYGEEPAARPLARAIVADRQIEPFTTSARLVQLVERVAGRPHRNRRPGSGRRGHPAKRTFQALRIEVNGELDSLAAALPAAIDALAAPQGDLPGGRLAVLAYHSLEDRLVKNTFRDGSTVEVPRHLPVPDAQLHPHLRLLTRGAERPDEAETTQNPRAASARLRAVENLWQTEQEAA
ncbi:16S rRNA (cytosine(1402)-N(4))-methyltransferase RsmH [Naumannella halotolerans]|uniref:16S rRNA (cytosine(1402)-N(4))-methyltransferase RsmH n=1 Tax=Naumannella halotolerans TaxID=993414 RepID=UPI00370D7189